MRNKTIHYFELEKKNKYSANYQMTSDRQTNFLTKRIKIEQFNGFSEAVGVEYYLIIRDANNWSRCSKITGLRPTKTKGLYYGDRKNGNRKTLILVRFVTNGLEVTEFPLGQYSHKYLRKIV